MKKIIKTLGGIVFSVCVLLCMFGVEVNAQEYPLVGERISNIADDSFMVSYASDCTLADVSLERMVSYKSESVFYCEKGIRLLGNGEIKLSFPDKNITPKMSDVYTIEEDCIITIVSDSELKVTYPETNSWVGAKYAGSLGKEALDTLFSKKKVSVEAVNVEAEFVSPLRISVSMVVPGIEASMVESIFYVIEDGKVVLIVDTSEGRGAYEVTEEYFELESFWKGISMKLTRVNPPKHEDSKAPEGSAEEPKAPEKKSNYGEHMKETVSKITAAPKETPTTIEYSEGGALSSSIMKALKEAGNVSMIFSFTYEGVDYKILVPAGKVIYDENIPWYGPLWLLEKYGQYIG